MITKPKFKSHLLVETVEPDLVFLISEDKSFVLKGRIYAVLAPFLDGSHTVSSIATALKEQISFLQIDHALYQLEKRGYISEAQEAMPASVEMLCHALGLDPLAASKRFTETKLFITSVGDSMPVEAMKAILQAVSIQICDTQEDADLCVVLTDDYLSVDLERFNNYFLKTKQPWMLIKPVGLNLQVGPLFVADESGCWSCLVQRLKLHRRVEATLQAEKRTPSLFTPPMIDLMPVAATALNLASIEIIRWILEGHNKKLTNHIVSINISSLEQESHVFVKRPQCPHCGDPEIIKRRIQQPVVLQSRKKTFTKDGGHRTASPEETFNRFKHHVSKVSGVLGVLERMKSPNQLINTYNAGQNLNYQASNYERLRLMLRNGDGGKGATDAQSRVSGLCEALERYSASFHGDEFYIEASYRELGEQAVHPNLCMNFSQNQYAAGKKIGDSYKSFSFNYTPKPFDEDKVIRWTPVWSLTNHTFKYLPTGYCYYSNFQENDAFPACSNGNAAGNTVEEAILQGLMELVERDGVGIWWHNRIRRSGVDLRSFDDPYINDLMAYYDSIDRDLWVVDVTSDLNIPIFAAVSHQRNTSNEFIIYGFGSHFDPRIGILRALTEVNQSLSCFSIPQNGKPREFTEESTLWWQSATIANQPYLLPDPNLPLKTSASYATQWNGDLKKDVIHCIDILAEKGMETLVLDQTQPDVGLSVVKVFVPGLCHFWRRFGAKRLYEVPTKMGWFKKPLSEDELNPFPVFF